MLIAFEGPDNVGKTYAADKLSGGHTIYNASQGSYKAAQELAATDKGIAQCFDRVGWFTHLVYRMALPDHPWGEESGYPVFAMPDTHLVFKLYKRGHVPTHDAEEGYGEGEPSIINQVYTSMAHSFMALNESRDYTLFKTVTIMEVYTDPLSNKRRQDLIEFSSPLHPWWGTTRTRLVQDDLSLFDLLSVEDAAR